MRRVLLALALLLASILPACAADTFQLTILHTNDVHGMLRPFDYADEQGYFGRAQTDTGGLARRATLIERARASVTHPVLLVDAGDVYTRGPWAKQFHGVPDIEAMNLMGYDALTVGNNEYKLAEGAEAQSYLLTLMRRSRFPWLAANVTVDDTGVPVEGLHPFVVRQFDDLRVGLLGLTTDGNAGFPQVKGWRISDPVAAARHWVPIARKECDILIAVTHLGEGHDERLAAEVSGLDAIVGGHSHTFVPKPAWVKAPDGREVPIVQAGEEGVVLGRLDLTFSRDGGWHLVKAEETLLPVTKDIPEDAEVRALLDHYLRPLPVTLLPHRGQPAPALTEQAAPAVP